MCTYFQQEEDSGGEKTAISPVGEENIPLLDRETIINSKVMLGTVPLVGTFGLYSDVKKTGSLLVFSVLCIRIGFNADPDPFFYLIADPDQDPGS